MYRHLAYFIATAGIALSSCLGAHGAAVRDTLSVSLVQADSTTMEAEGALLHKTDTVADVSVTFSKEYLDTVNVNRKIIINDYSLIGVEYGFGMSRMMFNPDKKQTMLPTRGIMGITYTRYNKMFGYMPYFGFKIGLFYGENGFRTKESKETGVRPTVDGAYETRYKYVEVPFLAHFHIDATDSFKLVADLGPYGAYRLGVSRSGTEEMDMAFAEKFHDYDTRFEYGIKGGLGVAFMFRPFELFFMGNVRYAFSSIYEPDYASQYYYRFASPFDITITAGIHIQLTKRSGRTRAELKKIARDKVYGIENQ